MAFTPLGVSGRSAVIRVAMVFRYEAEAALLHPHKKEEKIALDRLMRSGSATWDHAQMTSLAVMR